MKRKFTEPEMTLLAFAAQKDILESNTIPDGEWSGQLGPKDDF